MEDRHRWHIVGLQSQDDELQAAGAKVILQEFRHIGQSPGQGCRPWLFMASLEGISGCNKVLDVAAVAVVLVTMVMVVLVATC